MGSPLLLRPQPPMGLRQLPNPVGGGAPVPGPSMSGASYNSATTYDPDGTMRQATSGPMGGGPPGAAGAGIDINGLLAYKAKLAEDQMAQENDRKNRALSLQEWMARNAQSERESADLRDENEAYRARNAPKPLRHGTAVFTKTVGGAGITPGTIRLNQWEPGAAFSGYAEDLGTGPANATMSPVAMQAQGASRGLAADEWDQYKRDTAARSRVPAWGAR